MIYLLAGSFPFILSR